MKPFSNYPTISRPTLFNDTAALREGIEATEHIPWFLDMWQDASPKRRNTAGVQRKSVLKMFMEVDASKVGILSSPLQIGTISSISASGLPVFG